MLTTGKMKLLTSDVVRVDHLNYSQEDFSEQANEQAMEVRESW
jgi:hypothetical protein